MKDLSANKEKGATDWFLHVFPTRRKCMVGFFKWGPNKSSTWFVSWFLMQFEIIIKPIYASVPA